MGCTNCKQAVTRRAYDPIARQYSEDAGGDEADSEGEGRWRLEPQRALNQFVKTGDEKDAPTPRLADSKFFSGDSATFDYFQDDDFVELRTLLDEPLGRSHLLAHVDTHFEDAMDLVRLWLLLHKYHQMRNDDTARFVAAKNLYRHYFQISHSAKQEADDFKARVLYKGRDDLCEDALDDEEEDEDDDAQKRPPQRLKSRSASADLRSAAHREHRLEYERLNVPRICRVFPAETIRTILKLRPAVEQALYEAMQAHSRSGSAQNTLRGAKGGNGPGLISPGRPRTSSVGIQSFVDLSEAALRANALRGNSLLDLFSLRSADATPRLPSLEAGVMQVAATAPPSPPLGPQGAWAAETGPAAMLESTGPGEEGKRGEGMPPLELFMELQNEVFTEMKPLYRHFKETLEDFSAYKRSKKVLYNHVETPDFDYIELLGKGGFGHVVHVRKKSTGVHLAMKVQAKDTLVHTWGGKMQHVEIERDVLVAHNAFPFIVSLRYAFQDDKYAFLCLDLAEQGSLRQLLERSPGFQLEPPQMRLYVAEIVLALEALHDHEIIYRDLKPENVLLRDDGHVLLADMGLAGFYYQDKYNRDAPHVPPTAAEAVARAAVSEVDGAPAVSAIAAAGAAAAAGSEDGGDSESGEGLTSATGSGRMSSTDVDRKTDGGDTEAGLDDDEEGNAPRIKTIRSHDTDCGTPLYRPPEMIRHEHYGEGVDWFMLGVFTFECLVGRLPFEPRAELISDSGFVDIKTDEEELRLLRRKLVIPPHLDAGTVSLLTGLLDLDQNTRLGVGPPETQRDLASLKAHPFFVPLAGPLASECDWDKVLHKMYKPVYLPPPTQLSEEPQHGNFESLVKQWKKNARKEAKRQAQRRKQKANYDITVLKEGCTLDPKLEHYFDGWDYVDPESIQLEKQSVRNCGSRRSTGSQREGNKGDKSSVRSIIANIITQRSGPKKAPVA